MKVMVSECCNALPLFNRMQGRQGTCAKCNEWSEFYLDFWQENKITDKPDKTDKRKVNRRKSNRRAK